jgi:hypothetical protein
MFADDLPEHTKHIRFTDAGESSRLIEAHFLF